MLRQVRKLMTQMLAPPSERRYSRTVLRRTFRPCLEALEVRDVPATTTWTGLTSTAFGTSANWTNGVPAAGDDVIIAPRLVYVAATEETPAHWDSISVNCVGMHAASSAYASVTIVSTYTGTVTLYGGFTTGDFTLQGGTIDQPTATSPYSVTDITVTDDMIWTGGTLNSTSHVAEVTITGEGATMLFTPVNGGTLNCGSTINLEDEATGTMEEGELSFTNEDSEINIDEEAELAFDPGSEGNVEIVGFYGGKQINLYGGGRFRVLSGTCQSDLPLSNSGGDVILEAGTAAMIGGRVGGNGQSFEQSSGLTALYRGSMLIAVVNMRMTGGTLSIMLDQGTGTSGITVGQAGDGFLYIDGGDIASGANTDDGHPLFGELTVYGNVEWTGGTYRPHVDCEDIEDPDLEQYFAGDLWHVTGEFDIPNNSTAALAPGGVDYNNNQVTPPYLGMTWRLIEAEEGFTNPNKRPSFNSGIWAIDPVHNPVDQWDLRSVVGIEI